MKTFTLLLALCTSIVLIGCQSPEEKEKENFIKANSVLACESINTPKLAVETVESKKRTKEIFEKYEFPVENDAEMLALFDKYEYDEEVMSAIKTYVDNKCEVVLPE